MKNVFKEYHFYDADIKDNFLNNSILILDTNTLLNLYRFNSKNRVKFFEILEKLKDRLYLTYQIGNEFYRNREIVINDTTLFTKNLEEHLISEFNQIKSKIENCNFKGIEKLNLLKYEKNLQTNLLNILNETKNKIIEEIKKSPTIIEKTSLNGNDTILQKINELYEGKIIPQLNDEELLKIYKEGEQRYKEKIPPGYEDVKKEGNKKYGDLIIWKEMIKYSKEIKKDILFITDDTKEDWVLRLNGISLGPRKELLAEFKKESEQLFYLLSSSNFIDQFSKHLNITDVNDLEKEAQQIEQDQLDKTLEQKSWSEEIELKILKTEEHINLLEQKLKESQNTLEKDKIIYELEKLKELKEFYIEDLNFYFFNQENI